MSCPTESRFAILHLPNEELERLVAAAIQHDDTEYAYVCVVELARRALARVAEMRPGSSRGRCPHCGER